jgi:hypothetical protein
MRRYILTALLLIPFAAFATDGKISNPAPGAGLSMCDFINFLLVVSRWVVVPAIAIVIIYSGFEMATARGDAAAISTARQRLLGATIAAAVVFSAEIIISIAQGTVSNLFSNQSFIDLCQK